MTSRRLSSIYGSGSVDGEVVLPRMRSVSGPCMVPINPAPNPRKLAQPTAPILKPRSNPTRDLGLLPPAPTQFLARPGARVPRALLRGQHAHER